MRAVLVLALLGAFVLGTGTPGFAGSKDGPRRWTKVLKKSSEVVYKIEFLSNANPALKAAEFGIIGDGGTDVDIEVYDANGKMIASDTNYSDIAFVRWAPNQTQIYTIRVKNLGTEDNTCHFAHN